MIESHEIQGFLSNNKDMKNKQFYGIFMNQK